MRLTFGSTVESGSIVEISMKPKYSITGKTLTMKLKVNDGVNVYDNAALKQNYGDRNVHEINVLRDIKVELGAADYVAGTQMPINKYEYGAYTRIITSTNDTMKVNGNFFKIDGTALPLIRNDETEGRTSWQDAPDGLICDVQVGIFLYYNHNIKGN